MSLVTRNQRVYRYRSVRLDGRVTSAYLGVSDMPPETVAFLRSLREQVRAERVTARAEWEAERGRLADAERAVIEADSACEGLAATALHAVGCHRVKRGRWRRRRAEGPPVAPAGRPQSPGLVGLGEFVRRALALRLAGAGDGPGFDQLVGETEAVRAEVAGPGCTPLEWLLAGRVAANWIDAAERDAGHLTSLGGWPAAAEYHSRLRGRAHRRLLAACESLATVRRLATPARVVACDWMDGEWRVDMETTETDRTGVGSEAINLMQLAQAGDRAALNKLLELGKVRGLSYLGGWSAATVLNKLGDRASETNLMAREAVAVDRAAVVADLSEPGDGPIERIIIGRAALCSVDLSLAERDFQHMAAQGGPAAPIEALDRRRERSQRMLLAALRSLAAVRRMGRPAVQVNVGDGNVNVLKA